MTWPQVSFGDLYSTPSRNGLNRPSRVRGQGCKMVNMGELFSYSRIGDIEMERVQMNDRELENYTLQEGDLLFARQSLVLEGAGKCSYVMQLSEPTTFESHIIRVRLDKAQCWPSFYYYFFSSPYSGISTIVQQCAQAGIRGSVLATLKVPKPQIESQYKIASILSAYDDLIENNNRRIQLLEESARLLYQEWFVRFRFPGHEHTHIVDGVPDGWERLQFSDLAVFVNGYPFKPEELGGEGLPIVKIPELRSGVSDKTPRNTGENIPEKYLLKDGDLLFSWSGTLLIEFWYDGPAILNQHLFRVEPAGLCSAAFLLLALREALPEFANQTVGATMKHIRKGALTTVTTVFPSRTLLSQFDDFASEIFEHILNLHRQNRRLRTARDLLLPRLMSGEIAV